jgi:hypothetical protein
MAARGGRRPYQVRSHVVAAVSADALSRHAAATGRQITAAGQVWLACIKAAPALSGAVHADAQIEVIGRLPG